MDWLFRFFYTVLSLGILMIALLPVIGIFRFLLQNYEKKYTIWGWRIFFLRSICPVSLSSAFCLFSSVNRKYHLLLANFGLTVEGGGGIMTSWRAVYQGAVSATNTFKICSIIWAAGAIGIFLAAMIFNIKFRRELKKAELIGENIYEAAGLSVPVSYGIFRKKIYLPKGFQAKEISWVLRHIETHRFEGVRSILVGFIMIVHWFNPVMWLYYSWWKSDLEMAADEKTVSGEKEKIRKDYAQSILNFNKDLSGTKNKSKNGIFLFPGVIEGNMEKRAYRMLYQERSQKRDRLAANLLLSLTIIFLFLLTPMKMAWNGGTWGKGDTSAKTKTLLKKGDVTVVTRMGATSPEGLERMIQLEMISGEEGKKEYAGRFELRMYDSVENKIASCKIENLFPEIEKGKHKFSKDTTLCIKDYNGDGAKELVIGQQIEVPAADSKTTEAPKKTKQRKKAAESETEVSEGTKQREKSDSNESSEPSGQGAETNYAAYVYAVVSIEDKTLKTLVSGITAIGRETVLGNSIYFDNPEEINDIFLVPEWEKTLYYVWNEKENIYEEQEMTEDMLKAHREGIELSQSGETNEHFLKDESGKEEILVSTRQDSTGSEEIDSVTIVPGSGSKRFDDVEGYYCDLLWVTNEKGEEEKNYAQLIYNGIRAQTFVVYDVVKKSVYYRHEDGTKQLADVFKQYGEDITFEENGTVIYSLTAKEGDVLRINFAANADKGITVNGNYDYDVVKQTTSNLAFNRSGGETASPAPSKKADMFKQKSTNN